MVTGSLSGDVLLDVTGKLTMMGGIGLEAVNTFFQPPTVPAINAKAPKIVMRIKDVSSGHADADERFVLLTLHDKRKKGQWKILVKLSELKETFAKIFIRMKDFRALRICVADDEGMGVHNALSNAEVARKKQARRLSFETMLTSLSDAFISAASSFPPQSITVRQLFFPPRAAGVTTLLDDAINLVAFLGHSLLKLRLSTTYFFYHVSDDISHGATGIGIPSNPLLALLSAKCTGLQTLRIAGAIFEAERPQLENYLRSLPSLRSFEHSALEGRPRLPPDWFRRSFELCPNLRNLTLSYKILDALAEPSTMPILSQLTALNISFDYYNWPEHNAKLICEWIASVVVQNAGQGSALYRVLMGMSPGSLLSMTLKCSGSANLPSSAEELVKTILTLAALTNKAISATFLECSSMLAIVERLKNAHPLLDVKQTSAHCITIRDGTATCAFSTE